MRWKYYLDGYSFDEHSKMVVSIAVRIKKTTNQEENPSLQIDKKN